MAKVKEAHPYPIRTGVCGDDPYARIVLETASAALYLTAELFAKLRAFARERAPDERRDRLVKRYGMAVGIVYDALIVDGRKSTTAVRYAQIFGKFLRWSEGRVETWFTPQDIAGFLRHLVHDSRRRARRRGGMLTDPGGLGVERLAYYALKKVFDDLLEMDLVGDLPAPPRPDPIAPAAPETVTTLYAQAADDADRLMLLLTNGLDLRVGDVVRLTWEHVERACRTVTVERGDSARIVPVRPDLQPHLYRLRRRADACTPVFPSRRGPNGSGIGIRALQYRLSRLLARSALGKHVTLTSLCKARSVAAA